MKQLLALDDHGSVVTTVGVAVQPVNFERLRSANGSPRLADVPPDQDAREFELHFEHEISLDILTTREPGGTGAIARFLSKSGEGIQQVELTVHDVDRATEILRARFGQPRYLSGNARRCRRNASEFLPCYHTASKKSAN